MVIRASDLYTLLNAFSTSCRRRLAKFLEKYEVNAVLRTRSERWKSAISLPPPAIGRFEETNFPLNKMVEEAGTRALLSVGKINFVRLSGSRPAGELLRVVRAIRVPPGPPFLRNGGVGRDAASSSAKFLFTLLNVFLESSHYTQPGEETKILVFAAANILNLLTCEMHGLFS